MAPRASATVLRYRRSVPPRGYVRSKAHDLLFFSDISPRSELTHFCFSIDPDTSPRARQRQPRREQPQPRAGRLRRTGPASGCATTRTDTTTRRWRRQPTFSDHRSKDASTRQRRGVQKHVDADARLRTGTCESKSAIPITSGPERQLPDIDSPVSHKEACDDEHANDRNCILRELLVR